MADAFSIAIQSMQNDMQRMDIISENVANSATPGYRRALSTNQSFGDVLQSSSLSNVTHSIEITLPTVTSVLDTASGSIKSTSQPLDLAISGDGYFELTTPDGLAYTRAGNFHINEDGHLVSQDGYPVSGKGGDIIVNGKSTPTITPSGEVSDGSTAVGQIRIVSFADKHGLQTRSGGLLVSTNNDAETSDSSAQLQIGFLENANVIPLNEMVSMLETSRHFESQQKLFQGYDEQISSAIQKLGQF
ncbi:flagellar hook-basal body protein [Solimicrobium silvestre]|uniref:Flagellar hook-basal body protein n=1 Tax=Solimicrobium silvestre TaxID=2099400 RepID=A0A2S9H1Q0_9BURK|nr:flagellar hook basal-body protein [Solimicrobium silvestre]PRC93902.1 Flagellar hook-basal body protein [Solimicrobium silvestre]